MASLNDKRHLGTGWSFPVQFAQQGRELIAYSGADKVHASVWVILNTRLGERVMREDFGTSLSVLQFEPMRSRLFHDLQSEIEEAILLHEPRVQLDRVRVAPDPHRDGVLSIEMSYIIKQNNSRFNMVYPFYLNEGV